jgi:hypothetical protein
MTAALKEETVYTYADVLEWDDDVHAEIIDGEISVHLLTNGAYTTTTYNETDTVGVSVLPGCVINLKEVFPESPAGALGAGLASD